MHLIRAGSLSRQASNVVMSWRVIPWPQYVGVRAGWGGERREMALCYTPLPTPLCSSPTLGVDATR